MVKSTQRFLDPMMIYPNIVNMLGNITVDVNAMCLDKAQTYILMIHDRQVPGSYLIKSPWGINFVDNFPLVKL